MVGEIHIRKMVKIKIVKVRYIKETKMAHLFRFCSYAPNALVSIPKSQIIKIEDKGHFIRLNEGVNREAFFMKLTDFIYEKKKEEFSSFSEYDLEIVK